MQIIVKIFKSVIYAGINSARIICGVVFKLSTLLAVTNLTLSK